jgi:alpha-mannosidase
VWYHNLDKLIHYINVNASKGGPVVAFYSTPSHYTDAKYAMTKRDQIDWESRFDDVMPLANAANSYWSGYFTSRPGLKRQVRMATNFLSAARQMEVASNVTKAEVNLPTTRPSPPVGKSWTDSMEGAIGVATHHDGMSGTERQQVANDYDQRISEGHFEAEAGVSLALSRLAGVKEPINHCNCQSAGCEKTPFLSDFMLKMIVLQRQARDKHRKI